MAKKKKQAQPVSQTTSYTAPKSTQPIFDAASAGLLNAVNNPPQLAAPAPLDPFQLKAQKEALAAKPAISSIAGGAMKGVNFLTDPALLDASSNPHLQSYIDAALHPLTDQYTNVTLPALQSEAILNGGLGGSRQGVAQGAATTGYLRQVGDTTANIANQGYATGLNALQAGLGYAPSIATLQTAPAQVTGAVGAQNQQQAQNAIDVTNANKFLPVQNYADIISAAGGVPGGVTTSILPGSNVQGQVTTKKPSTLNAALGGAASGASLGSAFGPFGTAIGGGLGALYGLFGNK